MWRFVIFLLNLSMEMKQTARRVAFLRLFGRSASIEISIFPCRFDILGGILDKVFVQSPLSN